MFHGASFYSDLCTIVYFSTTSLINSTKSKNCLCNEEKRPSWPVYMIFVLSQNNQATPWSYRGKVLLIVNTATGCGLTPSTRDFKNLWTLSRSRTFEILDFLQMILWDKKHPAAQRISIASLQPTLSDNFSSLCQDQVNGKGRQILLCLAKRPRNPRPR